MKNQSQITDILATFKGIVPSMHNRYPEQMGRDKHVEPPLEEKCFMDKKGVYIPVDNLRMILIGNQVRKGAAEIVGSQIEAKKGRMFRDFCKASVWIIGIDDPLKVYYEPLRKKWDDVDTRSFVTKTQDRKMIQRPLICLPWSLTFHVQIMEKQIGDVLAIDKVRQFYEVGGLRCGIGVYGPTFGRYMVEKWEEVRE